MRKKGLLLYDLLEILMKTLIRLRLRLVCLQVFSVTDEVKYVLDVSFSANRISYFRSLQIVR